MTNVIIRRKYIRWMTFLVLISLLSALHTGCYRNNSLPAEAADVLDAMITATENIPSGYGRYYKASLDAKQALSPTLLSALYGESARQWIGTSDDTLLDDAAIYLTEQQHPFELAVLRCKNQGDISGGEGSVLGICQSRLAAVRRAWQGSDYEKTSIQGTVIHYGQFVILVIAEDPQPLIQAAKRIIRNSS